jgi:hypothetical protein
VRANSRSPVERAERTTRYNQIDDESPSGDGSQPVYSMDWLANALSEEAISKELDACQRIEEAMRERGC